jgi:radical SAM protein with 4Fe4S-binding SPASM domain
MYKDLRNVEKRDNQIYILNKLGHLITIPIELEEEFNKYAKLKSLPNDVPNFIYQLADVGILEFDNYQANDDNVYYDDSLIKSNDDKPVYNGPLVAHLAITSRCNMNCKYCSVRKEHDKISDELTTAEYKKIIDKLVDWGAFQIGLTGGEPTIREDVVELVKYITDKKVACNITTNGWNVTEKLVIELKEAGLNQIQISLDSYKKTTHEKFRTKGSYERALKTAKLFKKHGLIVGIDTVVSSSNIDDLEEFMDFLEENSIDGITIIKLKQGDLDLEIFKKSLPSCEKYSKLISKVCKRWQKPLEITIDCSSVANLCMSLTEGESEKLHTAGCPAGHTLISIAPNGDIYPCAALTDEKYKVGNMLVDDPKKIWIESKLLKSLRNIKNIIDGKCKSCDKLDICRGGCRGIADSLNKMLGSDPCCER